MSRIALFIAAAGLLIVSSALFAQEPASPPASAAKGDAGALKNRVRPAPGSSDQAGAPSEMENEVHAIRQLVEQQSKQLDFLARELAQVTLQLEEMRPGGPPAARIEGASSGAEAPPPAKEPPAAPSTAEAPKAEPVTSPDGELKHTVARGETLTSIAKHYNIPVAELQKANKIQDAHKLQIGQILNIPANKSPEPPTEKKETP